MNNIEQHISRLLLSNDCVIIPDFGGFITHYTEARYSEEQNMFLPPRREVGFNSNLTMNDSLLVQDFVETYDISYPEALRRIEKNVEELRQCLNTVGCYVFNGIGTIARNEDGQYTFKPFAAGIITPDYYALSAFEIKQIEAKEETGLKLIEVSKSDDSLEMEVFEADDNGGKVTMSVRMLRNIAAAVVAAIVFLLSPISLSTDNQPMTSTIVSNITTLSKIAKETTNEIKEIAMPKLTADGEQATMQSEIKENEAKNVKMYTIVMASKVSEKNATRYVSDLTARGMSKASAILKNLNSKVIYGKYSTQGEAYNVRNKLAQQNEFKDCWVMELNN